MEKRIINITKELKKLKRKIRVAVYVRVSTEKDTMLHSFKAQIDYYKTYINANPDYEFAGVFSDYAKSGTKDNRDEFISLIEKCKSGDIDMVITKSISRFARNTVTLLRVVRELKEIGVDVFFEEENMHSLSADGEMMLTLLAGVAQEESLNCSESVKWRIRKKFSEGKSTPFKMLGYKLINNELVVIEDEVPIVKRIFDMYLSGYGTQKIANILNDEILTTRTIYSWNKSTINSILRNEKYKGDLRLQKTYVENHITKKKKINDGVLPQFYIESNHEPIIDKDTWEKVNLLLQNKTKYQSHKTPIKSVFTSKLVCAKCGAKYKRKVVNNIVKWQCSTYDTKGKKYCASKSIREDILKNASMVAIGDKEFNETRFTKLIKQIEVHDNNTLIFVLFDEIRKEIKWTPVSRRDSWTIEKRQIARERNLKRNERKNS